MWDFVFSLWEWSLSCPQNLEVLQLNPTGLQSQMPWVFFPMLDPGLGSLTWSSELSLLWEIFCNIIIFQFVSHPNRGVWDLNIFEYITSTISLWFLYVFGGMASFFCWFYSFFYWWLFRSKLRFWCACERRQAQSPSTLPSCNIFRNLNSQIWELWGGDAWGNDCMQEMVIK